MANDPDLESLNHEVDRALSLVDELLPVLRSLSDRLNAVKLPRGTPSGATKSLASYGRAIIGLAKFLDAIGRAIVRLSDE